MFVIAEGEDWLMKNVLLLTLIALVLFAPFVSFTGTTGKIAGTITDADNREPLPGVNVVVEGTTLGAVTDVNGYYVILNVPPGMYTLRASYIGYATQRITSVSVKIDLTTTIEAKMKAELVAGEQVEVIAERPVVVKDIAASVINLSESEIRTLPVTTLNEVISLQSGVQLSRTTNQIVVRGSDVRQVAFVVDGFVLRDERDNTPYTAVSQTAVDEVQIQIGGFDAEVGNARAAIINIVTKEGKREQYNFNIFSRYSSPSQKHFGHSPESPDSYWIRPYVDPTVCWTGTKSGAWNAHTQAQFPEFEGWNSIALKTLQDNDPNNDLTPEAAQRVFLWQHRRNLDVVDSDHDLDATVGGPVPLIGKSLGNLRFSASYRNTQDAYVIPLATDVYRDYSLRLKLTSDISPKMKLFVSGIRGRSRGTTNNNLGEAGLFRYPESIANSLSRVSFIETRIFATDYWAPSTIVRNSIGFKLTHAFSARSFYDFSLHRFASAYETHPGRPRDTATLYRFGDNYLIDEGPFGFQPRPSTGINGMRMGVGMSNARDSSAVEVYTAKFDLSSQLDRFNQIKTGAEIVYADSKVNYGSVDEFLPSGRTRTTWRAFPVRASFYLQDKLEFEGMIAKLGARLDYSHAGGDWYVYDPYNSAFGAEKSLGLDTLLQKVPTERILNLLPRLAISFPISYNSKLYFNYGHYRQLPTPENLFLVRRFSDNNAVTRLANPNLPLPRTITYELGYEHNIADQFLLKTAGYYKDVSLQSRLVQYISRDGKANYSVTEPNNYQDIRGFEFELKKSRGNWVQGFINYTYDVQTAGNFAFSQYFQNPAEQRRYERETRSNYQEKPIPQPFGRISLSFFTPAKFGFRLAGIQPLADFRVNLLADWDSGYYFTWTGGGSIPGIVNNVQWRDFYDVRLRVSKTIKLAGADLRLLMDVNNLLNYKYLEQYGFVDTRDYEAYMKSLHLPQAIGEPLRYGNIPGDDRPGDYRQGPYIPWDHNADESTKAQWRKDKSYIDMPNQGFLSFLNPRDIFFGVYLNLNL